MRVSHFLLAAGLLCGAAVIGCGPTPGPTPPPTTTTTTLAPTPTPTPTPTPGCYSPSPGPDGDYVGVATLPTEHMSAILSARELIGRYECWPDSPDAPLFRLAEELRLSGLCAVKNEDRVIVGRLDGYYEEWHAIRYDTGCWASAERAYKGTMAWIGAAR